MNYEKLIYTNENNESVEFSAGSKFHVNVLRDVEGLADIRNTIYSSSAMGQHGDTYIGEHIEPREIEVTGKVLSDDKDTQILARRELARKLNPDLEGTLQYEYNGFIKTIWAKAKNTPTITHEGLSMEFSVVFLCLDPFWRDVSDSRIEMAQWVGAWEFPCEIDENDPDDMIFGYRDQPAVVNAENIGDVETGMVITLTASAPVTGATITNTNTGEYLKLNYALDLGDVVTINTNYGKKSVELDQSGVKTNIYRYLDVNSTFLQLKVGDNLMQYSATSGINFLDVSITYSPMYLGV